MSCPSTGPPLPQLPLGYPSHLSPGVPQGEPRPPCAGQAARNGGTWRVQPAVGVPGPRGAFMVPRDSSRPLLHRQARGKEPGALPMGPTSCFVARLWCLQLLCSGKDQQRFSSPRKVRARTNPQQNFAENGRRYFLFFFFLFFSCVFFPEIKTIS